MKTPELYPRRHTKQLDPQLFKKPTAEYRGAPFWCWNTKLDRAQLLRQLTYLKEMGMGGPTIHCRTGLDTEYLGDEFMSIVRDCVDASKKQGMLTWLYDEDRWPSGFAGGLVTKDVKHRAKHLLFTCSPYGSIKVGETANISNSIATRRENGTLLARYDVRLKDGVLANHRRLANSETGNNVWYAYLETADPVGWFNNLTYADTLSPTAMKRFIEVTYDRYNEVVGDEFGKSIPAIFTDEPQFTCKTHFTKPDDRNDLFMPWTTDFGEDLLDTLPEIFWELPDGRASLTRYRFHDQVAERFAQAFADQIGAWCVNHGVALTGHMMEESTLMRQTHAISEAMRSYRSFQIPGIDMLCDWREYMTAKQAQSAKHQYGRPAMLSEIYGVTDWDFDFIGHKGAGDWQAALGVTVRVHHLAWVSMAGEAKRDYPASIFYQSPWYKEYPLVENHFARLNTILTRGQPHVRVGVIHPIESFWLLWGPLEQTRIQRDQAEEQFKSLTDWLLHGLIDFDFIAESLLPGQLATNSNAKFGVGEMAYDVVIVPSLRTIRSTTLDRLEAFAATGGTIIFAGEIPSLVDAKPSDRAQQLAARCQRIDFNRVQILNSLAPYRELDVPGEGTLLSQMRVDGDLRHLFLCNTDRQRAYKGSEIKLRGQWGVIELDTFTGQQAPLNVTHADGWTILNRPLEAHGHLLITLKPVTVRSAKTAAPQPAAPALKEILQLADPVRVTLSEPNTFVLDQAEWRIDSGSWQPREEILRINNLVREGLGLSLRTGGDAQPWCDTRPTPVLGKVSLRFTIDCDVPVARPLLAVEKLKEVAITLDGKTVASKPSGWWVDEAIQTVRLPALRKGHHVLVVTIPFSRKTDLEWCYLLGDFGVALSGRHARIIASVKKLTFGDFTRQGLPFYTDNVTYHCGFTGTGENLTLEAAWPRCVNNYRIPTLQVSLDGKPRGPIAFAPFRLSLGRVARGKHKLDITCFGHRFNAFGSLHNLNYEDFWATSCPSGWRSTGQHWSYEYQLKPMGLTSAPRLLAPH